MVSKGMRFSCELIAHIDKVWPGNRKDIFLWELGRINEVLPGFRVIRLKPSDSGAPWIYITHGACEIETADGCRKEFFLLSPCETPRHIEALAMLATYHADPKYRLHLGDSVKIGRGWLEGSDYDHFLLSRPYPYGPDLEVCVLQDSVINFLWLLPINSSESCYLKSKGLEALECKFDEAEIDYLDPARPSVV